MTTLPAAADPPTRRTIHVDGTQPGDIVLILRPTRPGDPPLANRVSDLCVYASDRLGLSKIAGRLLGNAGLGEPSPATEQTEPRIPPEVNPDGPASEATLTLIRQLLANDPPPRGWVDAVFARAGVREWEQMAEADARKCLERLRRGWTVKQPAAAT
jgi:hypothetical protein